MKYILLAYAAEDAYTESEREGCYEESVRLAQELKANGQFLGASPLKFVDTAKSVRVRDGKLTVTDGPFAETREQLGGFYLVDARDEADALDIAARIPGARYGTIEVRPIHELEGVPEAG